MRKTALAFAMTGALTALSAPSGAYAADKSLPEASFDCRSCFKGLPPDTNPTSGPDPELEYKILVKPLYYMQANGTVWKADAGDVTDGATIPEEFLKLLGGSRFEPDFFPAAIIHDHYTECKHAVRTWTDTARVFYEAMIANHTPVLKAKIMYYAVYAFGPHWTKAEIIPGKDCGGHGACVNFNQIAFDMAFYRKCTTDGTQRMTLTYEPGSRAKPTDLEAEQVAATIEKAETQGRPLSLADIDRMAEDRHEDNYFLAVESKTR